MTSEGREGQEGREGTAPSSPMPSGRAKGVSSSCADAVRRATAADWRASGGGAGREGGQANARRDTCRAAGNEASRTALERQRRMQVLSTGGSRDGFAAQPRNVSGERGREREREREREAKEEEEREDVFYVLSHTPTHTLSLSLFSRSSLCAANRSPLRTAAASAAAPGAAGLAVRPQARTHAGEGCHAA